MLDAEQIHVWVLNYYQKNGLFKTRNAVINQLLPECEAKASSPAYRKIKGELAACLLQCYFHTLQQAITPSTILKSLCIPFKTGNQKTTEMDLTFVTPKCIFMFECKAYQGGQTVTDECTIQSSKPMNVYKQSLIHKDALMQYTNRFLDKTLAVKVKQVPYKLILFELSSKPLVDKRSAEWRMKIPIMRPETFLQDFATLYKSFNYDLFNYNGVVTTLKALNTKSSANFKKHVRRLSK